MEVAKFKENPLIYVMTSIQMRYLLLTYLKVITIPTYVLTHLLFVTYLLISNRRKGTPKILRRKIKPIAVII